MNASVQPLTVVPARQMPNSIEAEQALLGACLVNGDAIDIASRILQAEDFFDPIHARIWTFFVEARTAGRIVTVALIRASFGEDAKAEIAPGRTLGQYVSVLMSEAQTIFGTPDYARTIRHFADCRRIIASAAEATDLAYRGMAIKPADVAASTVETMDGIIAASEDTASPRISLGDAAKKSLEHVAAVRNKTRKPFGVTWGIRDLNAATLGMAGGHLILVCARTSMGKTTFAVSVAIKALLAGNGVYFVSLEMSDQDLADRALAAMAYTNVGEAITYSDIRKGDISPEAEWRLGEVAERLQALPFVIEQESNLSVPQISARVRHAKAKMERDGKKLTLVVVDHVGLVKSSDRYSGARHNEIGEISRGLKALAKNLGVPVLALCQLNREAEHREDKRPMLSDLNHSGSLEQDADVVIALYREAYYLERKVNKTEAESNRLSDVNQVMEVAILKNRQGPLKMIPIFASMPCNYLSDLRT